MSNDTGCPPEAHLHAPDGTITILDEDGLELALQLAAKQAVDDALELAEEAADA